MMKTIAAALTLTLLGTAAYSASSQDRAARVLAATPGLITLGDDDGGRVEVFRHGQADRELVYHGGAVVRDPSLQVVFLGDWSSPANAARKAELQQRVEQISTSEDFQSVTERGVRTSGMLIATRDVSATGSMNDLRIQSRLDAAMSAGTLSIRDENTVHLIFLAPGLTSTLGNRPAGVEYHSYHSHVQLNDMNVRYVVVPFDQDLDRTSAAARESLLRAIINPDGDGWY